MSQPTTLPPPTKAPPITAAPSTLPCRLCVDGVVPPGSWLHPDQPQGGRCDRCRGTGRVPVVPAGCEEVAVEWFGEERTYAPPALLIDHEREDAWVMWLRREVPALLPFDARALYHRLILGSDLAAVALALGETEGECARRVARGWAVVVGVWEGRKWEGM